MASPSTTGIRKQALWLLAIGIPGLILLNEAGGFKVFRDILDAFSITKLAALNQVLHFIMTGLISLFAYLCYTRTRKKIFFYICLAATFTLMVPLYLWAVKFLPPMSHEFNTLQTSYYYRIPSWLTLCVIIPYFWLKAVSTPPKEENIKVPGKLYAVIFSLLLTLPTMIVLNWHDIITFNIQFLFFAPLIMIQMLFNALIIWFGFLNYKITRRKLYLFLILNSGFTFISSWFSLIAAISSYNLNFISTMLLIFIQIVFPLLYLWGIIDYSRR